MEVMDSGHIVVGRNPSTPESRLASSEKLSKRATASTATKAVGHCGAMSQQRGDSGATSTPQKFVRLVGCRDAKARPKTRPPGGN
jgi:hypothetical protein